MTSSPSTPRTESRRDLPKGPIPDAITDLLGNGFTVGAFPRFHDRTSDIAVIGPQGEMFSIEVRNRATHIHDVLSPEDRNALSASHAAGRISLFITPKSTIRFRHAVAPYRGFAIDTEQYIVANAAMSELVNAYGWACWPALTPEHGLPAIAQMIADAILEYCGQPPTPTRQSRAADESQLLAQGEAESEISRLLNDHREAAPTMSASRKRVARALELHDHGVETLKAAAGMIGCAPSILSRDFSREDVPSPWSWGGARPNSGRKPR